MSMADRDGLIWFDGEMIPWRDAKVHVLTLRILQSLTMCWISSMSSRISICLTPETPRLISQETARWTSLMSSRSSMSSMPAVHKTTYLDIHAI